MTERARDYFAEAQAICRDPSQFVVQREHLIAVAQDAARREVEVNRFTALIAAIMHDTIRAPAMEMSLAFFQSVVATRPVVEMQVREGKLVVRVCTPAPEAQRVQ